MGIYLVLTDTHLKQRLKEGRHCFWSVDVNGLDHLHQVMLKGAPQCVKFKEEMDFS